MPPTRALLLDLDGTIADTLPHIFEAFRYAVRPWTGRALSDAEIEATFGPPERDCLAAMVPPEGLDEAEVRFFAHYEGEEHGRRVRIVVGLADVIERAKALGWAFGVLTNKGRRGAVFTLRELGLLDGLGILVSGDDVDRPKPDPEGVLKACETLGVPPDRILLAGDSMVDVQAGRAAGAKTAAVLWAAFHAAKLRGSGADFVCEGVGDLLAAIEALDPVVS